MLRIRWSVEGGWADSATAESASCSARFRAAVILVIVLRSEFLGHMQRRNAIEDER